MGVIYVCEILTYVNSIVRSMASVMVSLPFRC